LTLTELKSLHIQKKLTGRRVYLDCEANRIVRPTKIWCIVCTDLDSGEVFKFRPNSPYGGHNDFAKEFIEFCKSVTLFVGHNIISYDAPHINRLFGLELVALDKCLDTLVMSRLFCPVPPQQEVRSKYNRQWGHSLAAWGRYLNFPKGDFHEFDKFSETMLEYCVRDVELGIKIYLELLKEQEGFSDYCIELEHHVAAMLHQQVDNGFYLDKTKAERLRDETKALLAEMDGKLQSLFPPVYKTVRNYALKLNKDGTIGKVSARILQTYQETPGHKAVLKADSTYDLMVEEVFNPQSGAQIAERLLLLGWIPKYLTDKGNIKTDKLTLQEAIQGLLEGPRKGPNMEAIRCLADYSIVANRHDTALTWLELSQQADWGTVDPITGKVEYDGRVHGAINPIGAGTHRCSHYAPNMANIARVVTGKRVSSGTVLTKFNKFDILPDGNIYLKEDEVALTGLKGAYGWDSRDCWSVPDGRILVGADAAGIQLRALAHYMDDDTYTEALLKSDIHIVNQKAAGISTRARAKTFIYSWLMGGGDEKIGSIVTVKEEEYEDLFKFASDRKQWDTTLLERFMKSLRDKGRKADKKTVATIIKGFKTKEQFLDRTPALKRLRKKDMPEAVKQGYLIGLDGRKLWLPSEHLAMSIYLQGFEAVIMKQAKRNFHEQLRSENVDFKLLSFTHDEWQVETDPRNAHIVGNAMVSGIVRAGEQFKTNCPLDGEYKVGLSWAQTH